jgi:hypothetical protein
VKQLGSHCTNFPESLFWGLLLKPVDKIKVLLKSDKEYRHTAG